MKSLSTLRKAIDYIEENLKNDISIGSIASAVGYSEYHFLRIFKQFVGLTPASYIRKRRISEIVSHMESAGGADRPISDIAFEYGFNSKENFIRAFKAEHHILPTEFRRCGNSLLLYGKFELVPKGCELSCDIVRLDPVCFVAYPSDESDAPNFWNKYNVRGLSKRLSGGQTVADYGICRWNARKSRLDYWIGVKESDAAGDRSGAVCLRLSGGLYAVFKTPPATHFDFVSGIRRTWDYIRDVWLPRSRYERRPDYELECYVEESRLFSETVYVPIRIKTNKNTTEESKMAEIIKTYREDVPAMRFIGKKYPDFGGWWGEWFANGWFDAIERAMGGSDAIRAIWENGGGYVGLERRADGQPFEYWLGMFVPADTEAPDGFSCIDFPAAGLGTCWIYGREKEVHDTKGCRPEIERAGMKLWHDEKGGVWSFENCLCPRFTTPDENGNVIMDYCYFVE